MARQSFVTSDSLAVLPPDSQGMQIRVLNYPLKQVKNKASCYASMPFKDTIQ